MRRFVATTLGTLTLALGAAGMCASPLTASDLRGSWQLVELNSRPVPRQPATAVPMFTIKDQSIEGFDGCNTFWGRLDKPGSIASTRRGCGDDVLKLPLDLADPLSHLKTGRIQEDMLILPARPGMAQSVFRRLKTNPQ
jgi:heat shock protein HslJ